MQRILSTCRLLNVLVVVRGYKTVVRFFPHEAADLERVVDILEAVKALQPGSLGAEDGVAVWEAQAMLLLWLSILILIPFDLATVDSSALGSSSGCVAVPARLAHTWRGSPHDTCTRHGVGWRHVWQAVDCQCPMLRHHITTHTSSSGNLPMFDHVMHPCHGRQVRALHGAGGPHPGAVQGLPAPPG